MSMQVPHLLEELAEAYQPRPVPQPAPRPRPRPRPLPRGHRRDFESKEERSRRHFVISLTLIGLLTLIFYFCWALPQRSPVVTETPTNQQRPIKATGHEKTILFWHGLVSGNKNWQLRDTMYPDSLQREFNCRISNCILINAANQDDYSDQPAKYDALVFDVAAKVLFDTAFGKDANSKSYWPKERRTQQYYVLASNTLLMNSTVEPSPDFYNLTMTYRFDSDFVWHQFELKNKEGRTYQPAMGANWTWSYDSIRKKFLKQLFAKKHYMAAINLKSLCHKYRAIDALLPGAVLLEELAKLIKVDTYGCGHLEGDCDTEIPYMKYKFFLVFEDALCVDYVSPNFYRALLDLTVPVVFGGANYTRFAPPYSYIHAEDFESIYELAEYLNHLAKHEEEYSRYLWHFFYYTVETIKPPICDLCEFLNKPKRANQALGYHEYEVIKGNISNNRKSSNDYINNNNNNNRSMPRYNNEIERHEYEVGHVAAWWSRNECRNRTKLFCC